MRNLNQRMDRLEKLESTNSAEAIGVILRIIVAPGETEKELTRIRLRDGTEMMRDDGVAEDAFVGRAETKGRELLPMGMVKLVGW